MAFLTSSYFTPPPAAAARTRLPSGRAAVRPLLLLRSEAASGLWHEIVNAAVLPVSSARAAARIRCAAGPRYQPASTTELLTVATFTALADELRYWLNNPPELKEDLKKMEITAGKCVDLFPRLVHDSPLVPTNILQEIADIKESKLVKLHEQIEGEDPKVDTSSIKAAINGIERMSEIFIKGAPGLMGSSRS